MQKLDLHSFQERQGRRDGAITWALTTHGETLRQFIRTNFHQVDDDLYQSTVERLLATPFDQTRDILESGQLAPLEAWFYTVAKRQTPGAGNDTFQTTFEHQAELTDADEVLNLAEYSTDTGPQPLDHALLQTLRDFPQQQIVQALILREQGLEWKEIAPMVGYSSKQAAHKACSAPRVRQNLALAWRALKGDELCPDIATDLATVAWSVSELDSEIQQRVRAHVSVCPSCAAILETHARTMKTAPAFFPIPALAATQASHGLLEQLHAAYDWTSYKLHNAIGFFTTSATGTSWSAPKTAAATAATAIVLGTGGAAIHKVTSQVTPPKPATTQKLPVRLYDPLATPKRAPKPAKTRRTHKPQKPAPQQSTTPTTTISPTPARVGDGSAEFLPDAR